MNLNSVSFTTSSHPGYKEIPTEAPQGYMPTEARTGLGRRNYSFTSGKQSLSFRQLVSGSTHIVCKSLSDRVVNLGQNLSSKLANLHRALQNFIASRNVTTTPAAPAHKAVIDQGEFIWAADKAQLETQKLLTTLDELIVSKKGLSSQDREGSIGNILRSVVTKASGINTGAQIQQILMANPDAKTAFDSAQEPLAILKEKLGLALEKNSLPADHPNAQTVISLRACATPGVNSSDAKLEQLNIELSDLDRARGIRDALHNLNQVFEQYYPPVRNLLSANP